MKGIQHSLLSVWCEEGHLPIETMPQQIVCGIDNSMSDYTTCASMESRHQMMMMMRMIIISIPVISMLESENLHIKSLFSNDRMH